MGRFALDAQYSALCDPWGLCYDKDQSVAGGEAAWGGLGGAAAPPSIHRAIFTRSYLYRHGINCSMEKEQTKRKQTNKRGETKNARFARK